MTTTLDVGTAAFVERRTGGTAGVRQSGERRQFANAYTGLTNEAAELAQAIDQYKMRHRRRFITFEEMLSVIKSLGYERSAG